MKRRSEVTDPGGLRVRIRVAGQLDAGWSSWFEGLTVTVLERDETELLGVVADQAALHGLLSRIRDLGVPLLGLDVSRTADGPAPASAARDEPESSERPHRAPVGPSPDPIHRRR